MTTGGKLVLVDAAILGLMTTLIARPIAAQQCFLEPRAGVAVPVSDPVDGVGRSVDLGSGPGLGVGVGCRGAGLLTLGIGADGLWMSELFVFEVVAEVGVGFRSTADRGPWVELVGRGGGATTREIGARSAVLREETIGRGGPVIGVGGRAGVWLGTATSLLVQTGVNRLFLGASSVFGAGDDESGGTGVTWIPIAIGVRVSL